MGHTEGFSAVSITPDGKRAVSGSGDKTCILWDLNTGKKLQTLMGHTISVTAVSITPDGKMAISGSGSMEPSEDNTCILWDLNTGKKLHTLMGHKQAVNAVSITPDGKRAVSGSLDKTCILWDLNTGKKLGKFIFSDFIKTIALFPRGIFGGCSSGETFIVHAHRELLCPGIGIVTARQIWDFEHKNYQPISADCQYCGIRFSPPKSVLDTIKKITKRAGLSPEQSPCIELSKEVLGGAGFTFGVPAMWGGIEV